MKKVLYTMAMFSMVAMFAACGGDNKEAKEGEAAADTPTATAEKVAKKICDCMKIAETDQAKAEECMKDAEKDYNAAIEKYKDDEKAMNEFNEAGEKATQNCMK